MTRRRLLSLIAGAIAAVLLVGAVVLASSGPSTPRSDALVLDGHPPHSVELALTLSTGGSLHTSGTVWIDMATSALRATLLVPVVTADGAPAHAGCKTGHAGESTG